MRHLVILYTTHLILIQIYPKHLLVLAYLLVISQYCEDLYLDIFIALFPCGFVGVCSCLSRHQWMHLVRDSDRLLITLLNA